MAIVFKEPRLAEPATVDLFESRIGSKLPTEFRDMLVTQSNGGEIEPAALKSFLPLGVVSMLGVERRDSLDIELRLSLGSHDDLAEGLIPIADADGGNLVCLSLRARDPGAVWFWDHELPPDSAMTLLSDNFGKFLDDLAPFDSVPYLGPAPVVRSVWVNPAYRDLE